MQIPVQKKKPGGRPQQRLTVHTLPKKSTGISHVGDIICIAETALAAELLRRIVASFLDRPCPLAPAVRLCGAGTGEYENCKLALEARVTTRRFGLLFQSRELPACLWDVLAPMLDKSLHAARSGATFNCLPLGLAIVVQPIFEFRAHLRRHTRLRQCTWRQMARAVSLAGRLVQSFTTTVTVADWLALLCEYGSVILQGMRTTL